MNQTQPEHTRDVAKAARGDAAALEALLLHHHARLLRAIARRLPLSLQPCVSIEDIAQEVYVAAFRNITHFDVSRSDRFLAWLRAIARNKIREAERAARTVKRGGGRQLVAPAWDFDGESPVHLLELLAIHSRTPSRSIARREQLAAVEDALARIGSRQRNVLRLRFIEQLTVGETARRMDCSAGAVHMLTHRGLRSLCRKLGGCGCPEQKSA